MKTAKPQASHSHDAAVVKLLKEDPEITSVYLTAAPEESDQPSGQQALLSALRHVVEAQSMAAAAQRAGMPRESLYRALSVDSNPTIKTLLAVLGPPACNCQ